MRFELRWAGCIDGARQLFGLVDGLSPPLSLLFGGGDKFFVSGLLVCCLCGNSYEEILYCHMDYRFIAIYK